MAERRFLIVGGGGYIGARIAERLVAEGSVCITRRAATPRREEWVRRSGVEAVFFDSAVDAGLPVSGDFDVVINLAMPGSAEAARDPQAGIHAGKSVQACIDLLSAGRVGRLIHFSSFHVYGDPGRSSYRESDICHPAHPYGQIHHQCEQRVLTESTGLVLRPSNMLAAPAHGDMGDQARLIFLDLCQQAAKGSMRLHNDGASYRDFLPFEDVMTGLQKLFDSPTDGNRLFNLARGVAQSLEELAQRIKLAAPHPVELAFGDGIDAFRTPFVVYTERLQALGWQPQVELDSEIRRTIGFFLGEGLA